MPNFKLSRKAKADLKSIALYTDRKWGRDQRNQYIYQIDACFHRLADNPNLGMCCDEIIPGYRRHPVGSHIIFYRTAPSGYVQVIRILHKRMLPKSELFPD